MELSDVWGLRFIKESKDRTNVFVKCPSCDQNNFILRPNNSTSLLRKFNVSLRNAYCNNSSCNDRRAIQVAYDHAAQGFVDWAKWTINPNNITYLHQKANELNAKPFPELLQRWLKLNPEDEA